MAIDDSGIYTCEGYNRYGRQSTNGTVVVRQGTLEQTTPCQKKLDRYIITNDLPRVSFCCYGFFCRQNVIFGNI